MGRPGKAKVDYFPHVTNTGKTIAILESHWGNDGYAFWFKLLELIGNTNGFCYNCNSPSDWEYLLSKTRVTEEEATGILDKLAEIEAIDAGLWSEKRIWSDNFVAGVIPAFEKRKSDIPRKPDLRTPKPACSVLSGTGNGATDEFAAPENGRGEERNGEESYGEETPPAPTSCPSRLRKGAEKQADTVYLKPSELESLTLKYGSDAMLRMVELLDAYKTNHQEKCATYRDDYKVINAWVVSRYLEERGKLDKQMRDSPKRRSYAMEKLEELAREAAEHDTD